MPRKSKRSIAASARNTKQVATTRNTSKNVANNSSRPTESVETERKLQRCRIISSS